MSVQDEAHAFAKTIGEFVLSVASESHRAAVVAGVSLADESLTDALKMLMLPPRKKNDGLFRPDGPLGSFGARIELGRRIGFLESSFADTLDDLRCIRNAFAHSWDLTLSLADGTFSQRLTRMARSAQINPLWLQLEQHHDRVFPTKEMAILLSTLVVVCGTLRGATTDVAPIMPSNVASFRWVFRTPGGDSLTSDSGLGA